MPLNKGVSVIIRALKIPTRILSIFFLTRIYSPDDFALLTEVTLYASLLSLPLIMGRDTQFLRGSIVAEDAGIFDLLLVILVGIIILLVNIRIGLVLLSAALLSINAMLDAHYRYYKRVNEMLIIDYLLMVISTILIPLYMESAMFLIVGYLIFLFSRVLLLNFRFRLLWLTFPAKNAYNIKIAGGTLLSSLSMKVDNIFAHFFLSSKGFIFYVRSYSIFNIPIDLYGKYLNDYELVRIAKNGINKTSLFWQVVITMLIALTLYLNIELIVDILFGQDWFLIVSSMKVLVLILPLRVAQKYASLAFLGDSRDDVFMKTQIFSLSSLALFLGGLHLTAFEIDYISLSWAVVLSNLLSTAYILFQFIKVK